MWYGFKQDWLLVVVQFFALVPNGIMSNKKYEIIKVKITESEL